MNSLMVLIGDCDHDGGVPQTIFPIDVGPSQEQEFNQREMVRHGCDLQGIVAILWINYVVDGKALLQQFYDFAEVVGGYGPQHAIAVGVGEDDGVSAVPGDLVVEVGRVVEHERVGSVSREARQPFVYVEGQPLRGTPHPVWGFKYHRTMFTFEHAQIYYNPMQFHITNEQGEGEAIEVDTHTVKYYEPSSCIQHFTNMLIRPPRHLYNEDLIDPCRYFRKRFTYRVFHVPFPLSLYQPSSMAYVVLYLHGNASSRLQGYHQLINLPKDVGLACFDFDGCGNRVQRSYISLGKAEASEVDIAAAYLKSKGYRVIGWGRSMGSVSLLMSSECEVIVVDSPYSSLRQVCYSKVQRELPCLCKPCLFCLFPCLECIVNWDMKRKIGADLTDFQILTLINRSKSRSIMFLAAEGDTLIDSKHAFSLYSAYEGRKEILRFQGDHNSQRPIQILALTHIWIQNELEYQAIKRSYGKDYNQIELSPYSIDQKKKALSQMGQSMTYFQQEIANSHEQIHQQPTNKELEDMGNEVKKQANFPEGGDKQ